MTRTSIREQILAALSHPEAEDGLYFNNLIVVHEEEERPIVQGEEEEILAVITDLIDEGLISSAGDGDQRIFSLVRS